jgi:hypothetical protein
MVAASSLSAAGIGLILPLAFSVACAQSAVRRCCLGEELRLDFQYQSTPLFFSDAENVPKGFMVDLLQLVADETGMDLKASFPDWSSDDPDLPAFRFKNRETNAMLDETISRQLLYGGNTTIFGENYRWVSENMPQMVCIPIFSESYGGLVYKSRATQNMWRLFQPFTEELWIGIVGAILTFAFLLAVVEVSADRESEDWAWSAQRFVNLGGKAVYHALAAALSGEDYEFVTWPGRILRVAMLFFVLVTTATYTANLASFFTAPSTKVHGPQYMSGLRQSTIWVANQFQVPQFAPFAKDVKYAYGGDYGGEQGALGLLTEYNPDKLMGWVREKLRAREMDVYVSSSSFLRWFQVSACSSSFLLMCCMMEHTFFMHAKHHHDLPKTMRACLCIWELPSLAVFPDCGAEPVEGAVGQRALVERAERRAVRNGQC